jgi:cell wall-associated NlpC family hydrolase
LTQALAVAILAHMRFLVVFLFLLVSQGTEASPAAPSEEPVLVAEEKSLLDRVGDVGIQVEAKASQLVLNAMALMGLPYRRGGVTADTGFDCSGFVRSIYEQTVGLILPRAAAQQAAATQKIDKAELQPGDLVFFNTMRRAFSHVGIYVGNGKFIHSPKPGAEVRVEDMGIAYWSRRFDGARRVPTDAAPAGTH